MYSVVVTRPGKVELLEVGEPEAGAYDIKIKTEAAFICNATDRKVIEGKFPGIGSDEYPILLGHETVGRVVEIGGKVRSFKEGDRVIGGLLTDPPGNEYGSGWGGFSEYVLARDHDAMINDGVADEEHGWNESLQIMKKVPESISLEAAGLLCTWREVYSGMFTDFKLEKGQNIVIFGAGPVGLSFIRFARLAGLGRIISIDPLENKRSLAVKMGADEAYAPDDPALDDFNRVIAGGADIVIDAVGNNAVIEKAVSMVRMGGSVCVYGVIGSPDISFGKVDAPYNFILNIHQWPTRNAEAAAHEPLIDWIDKGLLSEKGFVTGKYPVSEFQEAYRASQRPEAVKTMLMFNDWEEK